MQTHAYTYTGIRMVHMHTHTTTQTHKSLEIERYIIVTVFYKTIHLDTFHILRNTDFKINIECIVPLLWLNTVTPDS